ncbi:MAG TPA: hypothetical protein VKU00_32610 [Chthonomonadaceae bacterium]|nr:hypothetical protein [Chthonomonadaceae bacterium]
MTRQALRLVEPGLRSPLNVYVMECRDATDVPGPMLPGNWFGRDSLQEIAFVLPMERAVVAAWLAEAHGEDVPALAIPWWQEGWFATASAWLQTRAVALGRTVLAPVEQMRSAYTSAILRVLTDEGYLYLKVIPDALAQEITITQRLAQQDSDHFPTLLATTPDRMLLRDLGDRQPLGSHTSLARWEEIVRFYGELQVASVGSVPQWLAAGCLDLQTTHLAAQIQELIAHISERLQGLPQQLSGEERARLRTQESHLKALCEELAGYGVPDALEHGDLHAGNVALYATGFRLYDWSHACIMHPFYGFGSLFLDDDWFPEQPEALSRLRDAYLEAWTPYGSMPHLQAAFTLWQRLRPLFEAAHQSHVVATYQSMLGGNVYLSETATGNALQHMQWWLASHWRSLLHSSS